MPPLRIALVTRRFWPLVGGAERVMALLAEELRQLGARPTVVTAQWDSHWPREIDHAGTPVIRLPQPQIRGWGTIRYMWALSRYLRSHRTEIDAVLVSMLKHDAYVAVGAMPSAIPVVLRAEGGGSTGDCQWQREARFGARIKRRAENADAFIAPSESIADELRGAGYDADRVHFVPNGVSIPPERTPQRRSAARVTLGEANPDLRVTESTPVALYTGRLHEAKGLHDLVRCWRKVLDLWPEARLWLVGDGPERDDLYDRLKQQELRYHVSMPGAFDDVTELLYAADMFVLPSYEEGMSLSLLEAMAAGTPVIATDVPGNRRLVTHAEHGLLVPVKNPLSLAEAVAEVITLRDEAARRVVRARQRVEQEFSVRRMAEQHLELIEAMIDRKERSL
jgi:glycosyltransferase involved in cell wall biosynthesis